MIPKGDYIEDTITYEQDLKFRCEAVDEVVREGIFTLQVALKAYEVSLKDYLNYVFNSLD
jgi:hypothetical protein